MNKASVFVLVFMFVVAGSVLAVDTISETATPPASLLETPIEASPEALTESATSSATLSASLSATLIPTTIATPSATATLAPRPISKPLNPLKSLWNFFTGTKEEPPELADAPLDMTALDAVEENDDYLIAKGSGDDKKEMIWVQRKTDSAEWQKLEFEIPMKDDSPFGLYQRTIFFTNDKKTAIYVFDIESQGVTSVSYEPKKDGITAPFTDATGQEMVATLDPDTLKFTYALVPPEKR